MCEACNQGDHTKCIGESCNCPERIEDEILEGVVSVMDGVSDNIFRSILTRNSDLTKMFMEGAGPVNMRLFVREVVTTYRASLQ